MPNRPDGITCEDWDHPEGQPLSRRCRHYQDGGTCWFDDRFLCSEWAKRNQGTPPTGPKRHLPVATPGGTAQHPLPAASEAPAPPRQPSGEVPSWVTDSMGPNGNGFLRPPNLEPPHACHAHGCSTPVKPELLMCGHHWGMVPKHLKQAVWDAYRPGQCDDKNPSPAWHAAADQAIAAVAFAEQASKSTVTAHKPSPQATSRQPGAADAFSGLVDVPGSPDDGFALAPPHAKEPKVTKASLAAAKARAAWEATLPGGRSVTIAEPVPPYEAAKEIAPESIEALAAITSRIVLDAGPLGKVALVAERTAEDAVEGAPFSLTFQEAATLRLLIDSFPGARLVELKKTDKKEEWES